MRGIRNYVCSYTTANILIILFKNPVEHICLPDCFPHEILRPIAAAASGPAPHATRRRIPLNRASTPSCLPACLPAGTPTICKIFLCKKILCSSIPGHFPSLFLPVARPGHLFRNDKGTHGSATSQPASQRRWRNRANKTAATAAADQYEP